MQLLKPRLLFVDNLRTLAITLRFQMSSNDDMRKALDTQKQHWEKTYSNEPDFFGEEPSYPAKRAIEIFRGESARVILELGGGQGRDTFFFARNGFQVYIVDYCQSGVDAINEKAQRLGLTNSIKAIRHDVRKPLPFSGEFFDGCYSHMLFCMALTTAELESLSQEVRRVLKPNGLNMYTVRNTKDKHYGTGIHKGEDMYEVNGFIVHFFSKNKIEHLAKGYEIVRVEEFEEGELPINLFLAVLRALK